MNQTIKKISALALIPALASCGSFPGVAPAAYPANGDFAGLGWAIRQQQISYANGASRWVYSEFWSNLVLIPLAMGSVAALAFSHGSATTNILAGIGIGVGATSLLTTNLNGANKQQAYSLASYQLLCLSQTASVYLAPDDGTKPNASTNGASGVASASAPTPASVASGTSADTPPPPHYDLPKDVGDLSNNLKALNDSIAATTPELAKVKQIIADGTTPSPEEANVINLTALQLQQANSISTSAQAEINAANQAYFLIAKTFSKIDQQAYASSKGTLLTWSQATGAFNSTGGNSGTSSGLVLGTAPKKVAPLAVDPLAPEIKNLSTLVSDLSTKSNAVANSPAVAQKTYTSANTNIATCATGAP